MISMLKLQNNGINSIYWIPRYPFYLDFFFLLKTYIQRFKNYGKIRLLGHSFEVI